MKQFHSPLSQYGYPRTNIEMFSKKSSIRFSVPHEWDINKNEHFIRRQCFEAFRKFSAKRVVGWKRIYQRFHIFYDLDNYTISERN